MTHMQMLVKKVQVYLYTPINPEVNYSSSPFEHFLQLVDSERSENNKYDTPSSFA